MRFVKIVMAQAWSLIPASSTSIVEPVAAQAWKLGRMMLIVVTVGGIGVMILAKNSVGVVMKAGYQSKRGRAQRVGGWAWNLYGTLLGENARPAMAGAIFRAKHATTLGRSNVSIGLRCFIRVSRVQRLSRTGLIYV